MKIACDLKHLHRKLSLEQASNSQMLWVVMRISYDDRMLKLYFHKILYSALRRVQLLRLQIHQLEELSLQRGVRKKLATCWEVKWLKVSNLEEPSAFLTFLIDLETLEGSASFPVCSPILNYALFLVFSQSGFLSTRGFQRPAHWQRWTGIRGALAVPVSSTGLSIEATRCSSFDA